MPQTLSEKVWERHVVHRAPDEPDLLYIDLHLVHEVTSPQAFDGLRLNGRGVRRPDLTVATMDHNVPTTGLDRPLEDPISARQMEVLAANCAEFGIELYPMGDRRQGIVHVIGPEQGLTQPGMVIVCGDSHTSTHGAFGALAFGIGTSEVEHVLATQTLPQTPPKTMAVVVDGDVPAGVTAKDIILAVIGRIGTSGGMGHVIEYRGKAFRDLSMEGRMTVCNMSIEAGARAGLVGPDDTTFAYLEGRPRAPRGAAWEAALGGLAGAGHRGRRRLRQAGGARRRRPRASRHLGHQPRPGGAHLRLGASPRRVLRSCRPGGGGSGAGVHGSAGRHAHARHRRRHRVHRVVHQLPHRGPPGRRRRCWAAGRSHDGLRVLVVPGSGLVKEAAEAEGLDKIFTASGAEWREPGCSMCLAMNPDKLAPGERSASTSNRNFEGRQGRGGRTHLVSPAVAAATAVAGHLASPADL